MSDDMKQLILANMNVKLAVWLTIYISQGSQGVATGGISVYIYTPKSVYLKKIMWLFFSFSPMTQDRFDMIYVHVGDINIFWNCND